MNDFEKMEYIERELLKRQMDTIQDEIDDIKRMTTDELRKELERYKAKYGM